MRFPRLSVAGLLALVAAAAIEFAAVRALIDRSPDLLLNGLPAALALQYGGYRAAVGRGRSRAAWAGFAAGSGLALASYAYAMLTTAALRPDAAGMIREVPGSAMDALWRGYLDRLFGSAAFRLLFLQTYSNPDDDIGRRLTVTLLVTLPILLAGLAGAAAGRAIAGGLGRHAEGTP